MPRPVRFVMLLVAVSLLATAAHRLAPRSTLDDKPDEPGVFLPSDLVSEEVGGPPPPQFCGVAHTPAEPVVDDLVAYSPDWIEVPPVPPPPYWWSPERRVPQVEPGPAVVTSSHNQHYPPGLYGRGRRNRSPWLAQAGGDVNSHRAVERAQAWLARQQRPDGSWSFDGTADREAAAATGAALLPFLGAGHTHRTGKYQRIVERGVRWLIQDQRPDGSFRSAPTTTGHALTAIALAECYGLTRDAELLAPARAAFRYSCATQNGDGGWGESPGTASEPGPTAWQMQAQHATLTAGVNPPDSPLTGRALRFLGGHATPASLLGRILGGRLKADHPDVVAGVAELVKGGAFDVSHLYHATWAAFLRPGNNWDEWNAGPLDRGVRIGGVRDLIVATQVTVSGPEHGSWDPDDSVGREWGRLGTTVLATLTLEVYYRYPR